MLITVEPVQGKEGCGSSRVLWKKMLCWGWLSSQDTSFATLGADSVNRAEHKTGGGPEKRHWRVRCGNLAEIPQGWDTERWDLSLLGSRWQSVAG